MFKIFRSGSPEEWILWRQDFNEVCTGMLLTTGPSHNRMIRQLLTNEPLKEFELKLSTFVTETVERSNHALDAVAEIIFSSNANAKQKKYLRQGIWKPRALTIRKAYTRLFELNTQLGSYPHQTGLLPEDELKSAFITICAPEWQQEFLKTGINEYSSTWEQILTKAEALLEQAEGALAEQTTAKTDKRDREDGEVVPAQDKKLAVTTKKQKKSFYCRMHGPDQRHNTDDCKVINAEIEKLKGKTKPSFNTNNTNNNQQNRSNWNNKKRSSAVASSYSTEQMKDVVRMTQKKATTDAKTRYDEQIQEDLHAIEIMSDASEQKSKMQIMESFSLTIQTRVMRTA
jgi:hypothetical protein